MDFLAHNRSAWNHQVASGNEWTVPVSLETVESAKKGHWSVVLTGSHPVPRDWFGSIEGKRLLCLASGGGQQGPVLAAAGARVTVFDLSEAQLERDATLARQAGLNLRTVRGDMRDLAAFEDVSFDIVFHPVANCFIPELAPLWRECHRVLVAGGVLMAGFLNPVHFIFDQDELEKGRMIVRHKIPFSELEDIEPEERQRYIEAGEPLVFGHSLADQIGGQLEAGFLISDFFEHPYEETPLAAHISTYQATRAIKKAGP